MFNTLLQRQKLAFVEKNSLFLSCILKNRTIQTTHFQLIKKLFTFFIC